MELHRSGRTAVYRIEARAQDGRLVAAALARVFRTDRPWAAESGAAGGSS
jgi:acyl-CoA thioesterase